MSRTSFALPIQSTHPRLVPSDSRWTTTTTRQRRTQDGTDTDPSRPARCLATPRLARRRGCVKSPSFTAASSESRAGSTRRGRSGRVRNGRSTSLSCVRCRAFGIASGICAARTEHRDIRLAGGACRISAARRTAGRAGAPGRDQRRFGTFPAAPITPAQFGGFVAGRFSCGKGGAGRQAAPMGCGYTLRGWLSDTQVQARGFKTAGMSSRSSAASLSSLCTAPRSAVLRPALRPHTLKSSRAFRRPSKCAYACTLLPSARALQERARAAYLRGHSPPQDAIRTRWALHPALDARLRTGRQGRARGRWSAPPCRLGCTRAEPGKQY
ncbi:hypothetical protein B0H17DRAFT_1333993 [Mycena rosella]|uniref:Uncharacterized protein n=1 Tax=Mycena rosella TaxID=1033263 RepID=A0AAD7G8W9_MYCRO|nr:hypothetical protein B0H17DRAFT_1333993 [Mycena rosella]